MPSLNYYLMKKVLSIILSLMPLMVLAQGGNPYFQPGKVVSVGASIIFSIIFFGYLVITMAKNSDAKKPRKKSTKPYPEEEY